MGDRGSKSDMIDLNVSVKEQRVDGFQVIQYFRKKVNIVLA